MAESESPKRAAGKGGRAQPARPVGAREHYVGIGILSLVILLCTWILIRGLAPRGVLWGDYDPSLFAGSSGQPATEAAPATPPESPSATGYADAGDAAVPTTPAAAPTGTAQLGFLPLEAPSGLTAGQVESFTPENLYEKINGRAEEYIPYGVAGMECMSFTNAAGGSVEVYLFDMGEPLNAFGKYAAERAIETLVELGQEGYVAGGSVYFWQQRYYAQIMDGTGSPDGATAALALAKQLAPKLPAGRAEIPGEALFPAEGLVPHSIGWVRQSALGQQWLNDVWVAKYKVGETIVECFLTRRATEQEAGGLRDKYVEFMKTLGATTEQNIGGVPVVLFESSGSVDMVFAKGTSFGGVTYVAGRKPAETVIARLIAAP